MIVEAAGPNAYRWTWERRDGVRKILMRLDGKEYSNDSDGRDYEKDSALPSGAGTHTMASQRQDDRHLLTTFKAAGREEGRTTLAVEGDRLTFHQWTSPGYSGKAADYTLVFERDSKQH